MTDQSGDGGAFVCSPGVVDEERERGEGGAEGAGGDGLVVEVGREGLPVGGTLLVLAHHQVVQVWHPHRPQHLHLKGGGARDSEG
eukprot:772818-Prorocentrum_minimum.AAC.1